jgi:ABC-type multidrug transport system ATPase subunit
MQLPDLVFLDEPTTGLDSAISMEVIGAVRCLADQGRTVLCTIHQPSPDVYKLFDKLILLADGRLIYFGPAKEVAHYFSKSPYQFPFVPHTNPADFAVAVAGGFIAPDLPDQGVTNTVSAEKLGEMYANSVFAVSFGKNIGTALEMDQAAMKTKSMPAQSMTALAIETYHPRKQNSYGTSTIHQIKTLCKRVFLEKSRRRVEVISSWLR